MQYSITLKITNKSLNNKYFLCMGGEYCFSLFHNFKEAFCMLCVWMFSSHSIFLYLK